MNALCYLPTNFMLSKEQSKIDQPSHSIEIIFLELTTCPVFSFISIRSAPTPVSSIAVYCFSPRLRNLWGRACLCAHGLQRTLLFFQSAHMLSRLQQSSFYKKKPQVLMCTGGNSCILEQQPSCIRNTKA